MGWLANTMQRFSRKPASTAIVGVQVSSMSDAGPALASSPTNFRNTDTQFVWNDGDKFTGGFGPTKLFITDYWTLRARSAQLFESNLYARGMVRRLVTNVINTGLHLEAVPEESLLGLEPDDLADWSEDTENRFALWGKNPKLCDDAEQRTFGELQATAKMEALIEGDVLVVLVQDRATGLPRVKLVPGSAVQSPINQIGLENKLASGNRVEHGVEVDASGRQVAYWIRKPDVFGIGTFERLAAVGRRSGRRIAWLHYGNERRVGAVRGQPLLGLVLQSLNEIDKYRDSVQRKAVINAILAMFIQRDAENLPTLPMSGGAIRRGVDTTVDSTGATRSFKAEEFHPGLVIEELNVGETPVGFSSQGTDEKFGDFEEAIIQSVAWANEIPPEILRLSFSSNYSASQAAINEFKMYLNKERTSFGDNFCQPIYVDFLITQVLQQRIIAPGFLESWRDAMRYDEFGAWISADWSGHIKPAVDPSKLVKSYKEQIEAGLMTRDRASRELNGSKYSKNVQKLRRENEQLAEANESIVKLEQAPAAPPAPPVDDADDNLDPDGLRLVPEDDEDGDEEDEG